MDSNIIELSKIIAKETAAIEEYLQNENLPSPSWDSDSKPVSTLLATSPISQSHEKVIDAARDLIQLLSGPLSTVLNLGSLTDPFVMTAIHRLHIADHIPIDGQASYESIAAACGQSVSNIRRILYLAMANHVFKESPEGEIMHTATSKTMRSQSPFYRLLANRFDELNPAAFCTIEALQKYPESQEPTESGWAIANNASKPLFEELAERHPERAARFAGLMEQHSATYPSAPLLDNYPWESLGSATIVDVGGGRGPVAIALAQRFPSLKVIVQDLGETVTKGPQNVPVEIQDRVSFMEHNFFEAQPVSSDVYFYRAVFHNWPDKYCIKMLRALIPALKVNSRVIINERMFPSATEVSKEVWKQRRAMDLAMLFFFNAPERREEDYSKLFREADPRFTFLGIRYPTVNNTHLPSYDLLAIVEARWDG